MLILKLKLQISLNSEWGQLIHTHTNTTHTSEAEYFSKQEEDITYLHAISWESQRGWVQIRVKEKNVYKIIVLYI